jgi:DNA topoisomerase-2
MYIGGVRAVNQDQWVIDTETGKFSYKTLQVTPGLFKIINEIIDNSIDVAIDTNFKAATKIQVKIDNKSVTVTDNGIGIPVKKLDDGSDDRTLPEIAWTTLRSGTSFSEDRNKIGTNGLGSVSANIFSKVFIATSDDGKKQQTIKCIDNMSVIKPSKVKPSSGKAGVEVYFEPDLERFGMAEIDKTHQDLVYQRLFNLAISFPKIKFSFNGKQINISEKKFAGMFSDNALLESSDNTTICVFPNEYDEFKFYAQLNGLNTFLGGSHVDYIANEITSRIRDKLVKKYKTIRPGDIKNKMGLAVVMTGFKNPEFNSQSKEELKNAWSDISKHIDGKIDFDMIAKKLLKNEAFIDPIVETFKIKEELKARQELKKAKKVKVKSDKYFPGIGEKKYLFLVEGLSAGGGLMKCLGRIGKYFYCLRGLALNAYDSSIQRIAANQEIKEVMNILNLDMSKKSDEEQQIEFDKIVIATDADIDGINISSMLFGWWYKLCPSLYKQRKIFKLNTPVVIVEDSKGNIVNWFFKLDEFKKWEASSTDKKLKIVYLKGLGSLSTSQLDFIIQKQGFDSLLEEYTLDDKSDEYFKNWLGPDAEPRKKYMKEYDFDINSI